MASKGDRHAGHERFWELAEPHLAGGRLVEGTMMGHQCLRTARTNAFVATVAPATGDAVMKLPKDRVTAMIEAGLGRSFAPAGKVFREWIALPDVDDEMWESLLEEAIDFVDGSS